MGLLFGNRNRNQRNNKNRKGGFDPNGGKAYRIVFTASIIAVLIGIIFLVYSVAAGWSSIKTGLMITSFIVCAACFLSLSWIRKIETNQFKILAWVFIGIIAFCALLWIIFDFLIVDIVAKFDKSLSDDYINRVLGIINYLRIILIITLQFGVASFAADYVTKFKNRMLVFQIITYASLLVIDIWITLLACSLGIVNNIDNNNIDDFGDIFKYNENIGNFIFSVKVWPLLIIALLFMVVAISLVNILERRRAENLAEKATEDIVKNAQSIANRAQEIEGHTKENDPQTRLEKLKNMLESGLITEEEYNKKREDIINQM